MKRKKISERKVRTMKVERNGTKSKQYWMTALAVYLYHYHKGKISILIKEASVVYTPVCIDSLGPIIIMVSLPDSWKKPPDNDTIELSLWYLELKICSWFKEKIITQSIENIF